MEAAAAAAREIVGANAVAAMESEPGSGGSGEKLDAVALKQEELRHEIHGLEERMEEMKRMFVELHSEMRGWRRSREEEENGEESESDETVDQKSTEITQQGPLIVIPGKNAGDEQNRGGDGGNGDTGEGDDGNGDNKGGDDGNGDKNGGDGSIGVTRRSELREIKTQLQSLTQLVHESLSKM